MSSPLLEIPVCHAGKPDNPETPEKIVTARVLPGEIAMYYPGYHWGSIVVLKSGYTFLTDWSSEQLDAAREGYYDFTKKNPTVKRNIAMVNKPVDPKTVN